MVERERAWTPMAGGRTRYRNHKSKRGENWAKTFNLTMARWQDFWPQVRSFFTRSGMTSSTRGSLVDYTEKRAAPNAGAISGYRSAMRSSSSRADFATRGSAISFLTLASVASRDSRISFFSGILRRCHRPQANAGQLRTKSDDVFTPRVMSGVVPTTGKPLCPEGARRNRGTQTLRKAASENAALFPQMIHR